MHKIKISLYTDSAKFHDEIAAPWEICGNAPAIIAAWIKPLSDDYAINDGVAVHKTATVESGVILKPPIIISENCFVAAYAYLRGGVWLDKNVILGPSSEIKSSFICAGSKAAHFNFVGDSIIGENVNIEAGAVLANYRNEWDDREIICSDGERLIRTGRHKFGSLIGDNTRIGANAVLAPGTLLAKNTIVKRLERIDQVDPQADR